MRSAFGVEHTVSKRQAPDKVPDWMSGAVPASAANAYNRSSSRKLEAGASNFAVKSGASAAGAITGIGLTALAVKTKKLPKWFLRDSTIRPIKHITKNPTTIKAGEKQRSIATTTGGVLGGIAGGSAAQWHLKRVGKNPRYNEGKVEKGLPSWVRANPAKAEKLAYSLGNIELGGKYSERGINIGSQAARKKAAGKWLETKIDAKRAGRSAELNNSEYSVKQGEELGHDRRMLTGSSYRPKYNWKKKKSYDDKPEPQWKGWQGKLNTKFAAKKKADMKRAREQGLT